MTVGPSTLVRVGLLVLIAVVLQVSSVGPTRLLGGNADLVPLVVAAIALYSGSIPGAATGFFVGFLLDLTLGQSLGGSSLVLTAIGYGAGRFGETRDPSHGLIAIPVGALASAGWAVGFGAVSFMLEFDASVSALVFREMLVMTALNAIIAIPVFAIARRVIRPVLTVDPYEVRRRRRPPRESGPIGLRGLEV